LVGGGLLAVAGIIVLLVVMLGDDAPSGPRKSRKGLPAPAPQEQVQKEPEPVPAPEEKRASPVPEQAPRPKRPPPEEKAPQAEEKRAAPEQKKAPPPRQMAQGKVLGTLMLNPGASIPVMFAGNALPKQVGAYNL